MNWFPKKLRKPMVKGVRINKERLQELLKGRNYSAVGRALRLSSVTIWHLARGEQDRVLRTTLAKLEGYFKEKLSSHWDYVEKYAEKQDKKLEKLGSHWDYVEEKGVIFDKGKRKECTIEAGMVKIPVRGTVGDAGITQDDLSEFVDAEMSQLVTKTIKNHQKQISILEEKIKNLEAILPNL